MVHTTLQSCIEEEKCECDCREFLLYTLNRRQRMKSSIKENLRKFEKLCHLICIVTGKTLLHSIVEQQKIIGCTAIVQYLIEKGCDVNARYKDNITPLFLAIKRLDVTVVDFLLENNADICSLNPDGISLLQWVAQKSMMCYSSADPFESGLQYREVCEAIFKKLSRDFLADKDNKVGSKILTENSVVRVACLVFGTEKLVKFILLHDNVVNYRLKGCGKVPLHYAIIYSKIDNAKLLIQFGARMCAVDDSGRSPLYNYAYQTQYWDVDKELLKLMLQRRSYVEPKDLERIFTFGTKSTVKTVLQSGIEIPQEFDGKSLFFLLTLNESEEAIELLDELSIKFDVNERLDNGGTALHYSSRHHHLKRIEFHLNHGADVNSYLFNGMSVLKFAAMNINYKHSDETQKIASLIIQLLLQHGAVAKETLNIDLEMSSDVCIMVMISHLALLKALGKPSNGVFCIKSLRGYGNDEKFRMCEHHIEAMKTIEVHEKVNLFQILYETEENLINYVRNKDFVISFNSVMIRGYNFQPYYLDTLKRRISKAIYTIEMREKVALIIEKLTGICSNGYFAIVQQIIGYLSLQDMRILCMTDEMFFNNDCSQTIFEEEETMRFVLVQSS